MPVSSRSEQSGINKAPFQQLSPVLPHCRLQAHRLTDMPWPSQKSEKYQSHYVDFDIFLFFYDPRWIKKWQFFMHKSQIEFIFFFKLTSLPEEVSLCSNFLKDRGHSELKFVQDLRELVKYRKRYRVLQMAWITTPPRLLQIAWMPWRRMRGSHSANTETSGLGRPLRLSPKCTWNWKWFQFLALKDIVVQHFFKNNPLWKNWQHREEYHNVGVCSSWLIMKATFELLIAYLY